MLLQIHGALKTLCYYYLYVVIAINACYVVYYGNSSVSYKL